MILALLLALAVQAPVPQTPPKSDVLVAPRGGIEAPTQPRRKSGASVTTLPRVERTPGRGAAGRVLATVESLVEVRGQEDNALVGLGLVTGLAGTGDSANMVRGVLDNMLRTHNIKIDVQQLSPKNVALVRVEAVLPPGIKPGQRIDVRVSTLGDAKSIENGTLALTELTDITGQIVFATAQGPVTVGGFSVQGEGASAQKNSVTVGVLPLGGKVERAVESQLVSENGFIYLDARAAHGSFGNMVRITETVNALFPGAATPEADGRAVRIEVPSDLPESEHVAYLAAILKREIEADSVPRVVINERTGVIVMGEGVRLRPGAVTHGALTVTVAESPEVSQPGPLSAGQTKETPRTDLNVTEENNGLTLINGAVTLQEVVEVLNVLGTTPRDLISILEAMSQAGLLLANVERM
ncbi:MAG: flagellar basal body P-ring protein FlgI [Planctomycetes bacterium]|jgi:flagellar P-ring protein precursor FlgI|nr:flagellar basal body P-ring protein FlgI [Planctomycetota bacterium]